MGVIPIVRSTTIDSVFVPHFPQVLVVDQWEDITLELLESHWQRWGGTISIKQESDVLGKVIPPLTQRYWMEVIWNTTIQIT